MVVNDVGISAHNSDAVVVDGNDIVRLVMFVASSWHTGSATPIMEVR